MHRIVTIGLSGFCAIYLLGAGFAGLLEEAPERVGPGATAKWDPPAQNEDGSPLLDLAGYRLAVSEPTEDLRVGGEALGELSTTETSSPLAGLLAGLPEGPKLLWVRAVDESGNASQWSEPLAIDLDPVRPVAPGGLRVEVEVRVSVRSQ